MAKLRTMPDFRPAMDTTEPIVSSQAVIQPDGSADWRRGLPVLKGKSVTLRELRPGDAATLFSMLSNDRATRFVSPPPATLEGFSRFIDWAAREREQARYVCYGIVPDGMTDAIGVFQVRALDLGFSVAEWGFAMGSGFWGTDLFAQSAQLVLEFAFDVVGIHRLEARAAVANGRGNGALRKVGAVQEGILRRSFHRSGDYQDQVLWSLLADDWRHSRADQGESVH